MKKPIRLYLAILNRGWLRREIAATVLPAMQKTAGVELLWENPSKTWSNPISCNRNKITKRFLQTDCDFLMMLDDDIIPLHNPAELVFADKDIIGSPAKVRQRGKAINWTAYVEVPVGNDVGYAPVDFSRVDDSIDLLQVDIVGTGCILIKRRVLEALKAPFHCEYNEDGECVMGTDFAFCRKAKRVGFEIFTSQQRVCEHMKQIGLLDIQGYDDSDNRDPIAGKYGIPWGDYAIAQKDWHFIRNIITDNNIKTILEFGAGLSSLLMSEHAIVVTYETSRAWMETIAEKVNGNRLTVKKWNGQKPRDKLGFFDLAFVDGPLGKINGGPGREHSIRIAAEHADKVIVHDAGRRDEMRWQNKYLRGKFKLLAKNGHHQSRCQYWVRKSMSK